MILNGVATRATTSAANAEAPENQALLMKVSEALYGENANAVLSTLTTIMASVLVDAANGEQEAVKELTAIACRNLEAFTDHLSAQHRVNVLKQSMQ